MEEEHVGEPCKVWDISQHYPAWSKKHNPAENFHYNRQNRYRLPKSNQRESGHIWTFPGIAANYLWPGKRVKFKGKSKPLKLLRGAGRLIPDTLSRSCRNNSPDGVCEISVRSRYGNQFSRHCLLNWRGILIQFNWSDSSDVNLSVANTWCKWRIYDE